VALHDATLARTTGDARGIDAVRLGDLPPEIRLLTVDAVLARYGDSTPLPPRPEGSARARGAARAIPA
jgi:hypothetical protein